MVVLAAPVLFPCATYLVGLYPGQKLLLWFSDDPCHGRGFGSRSWRSFVRPSLEICIKCQHSQTAFKRRTWARVINENALIKPTQHTRGKNPQKYHIAEQIGVILIPSTLRRRSSLLQTWYSRYCASCIVYSLRGHGLRH